MAATQKSPDRARLDELARRPGLLRQPVARPRRHRPRRRQDRRRGCRQGRPGGFRHASAIQIDDPGPRLCLARRAEADRRPRPFRLRSRRAAARSTSAPRPAASRRCCCERGAAHVTAIDVGHGQMHAAPARRSARHLHRGAECPRPRRGRSRRQRSGFHRLRCQLHLAEAGAAARAGTRRAGRPRRSCWSSRSSRPGATAIGKGGLLQGSGEGVRHRRQALRLAGRACRAGGRSAICPSPIEGGDGNREFLLAGIKDR